MRVYNCPVSPLFRFPMSYHIVSTLQFGPCVALVISKLRITLEIAKQNSVEAVKTNWVVILIIIR